MHQSTYAGQHHAVVRRCHQQPHGYQQRHQEALAAPSDSHIGHQQLRVLVAARTHNSGFGQHKLLVVHNNMGLFHYQSNTTNCHTGYQQCGRCWHCKTLAICCCSVYSLNPSATVSYTNISCQPFIDRYEKKRLPINAPTGQIKHSPRYTLNSTLPLFFPVPTRF